MIFKRLNRTSPEQVFIVVRADEAGIAADDTVQLDVSTLDGVGVEQPTGISLLSLCLGIADAAIANGAYGLVQTYGYRSTSRVVRTGASITNGGVLAPLVDTDFLETKAALAAGAAPVFTALDSLASSTTSDTASIKIFIRAM